MSLTAEVITAASSALRVRIDVGGVLRPDHQVGLGCLAGPNVGGQLVGLQGVQIGHRATPGVELQTRLRHVALDHGDDLRRCALAGLFGGQPGEPDGERDCDQQDAARPAVAAAVSVRWIQTVLASGGQRESGQRGEERESGGAEQRRRRQQRSVRLRVGDTTPRKAAERESGPQCLAGDPDTGGPDRPPRQPSGGRSDECADRHQQQGLGHRQRRGDRTHIDRRPVQQRNVEGQTEDQPEAESGPDPAAVHGQAEQGEPDHGQPPLGGRSE